MPGFLLHLPRFLRPRRSRSSLEPSSASPHDETGVLRPSNLGASPALSLRLPSRSDVSDSSTDASRPSASERPVDPQDSMDRLFVGRAQDDFTEQPLQPSHSVTPTDAVKSNPTQAITTPNVTAQCSPYPPYPPIPFDFAQPSQSLVPLCSTVSFTTSSQQSLDSQHVTQPSSHYSPQSWYQNQGNFKGAHDFAMMGSAFFDGNTGNVTLTNNISTTSSQFMERLLKETIPGAAADSSARYPPPRCHPGTRLAIIERCLYFIAHCHGKKKMRWIVGAAGVGKSAIMQNVADSPNLPVASHGSVFFSINGRSDGSKAIITLSYQFAAKLEPYRRLIESEIARDPSLLHSSMPVQFNKLIIEPFIRRSELNSAGRVLVIIDGLDECDDPLAQRELLRLISEFCIMYPSSPFVWLIASRPETHIISFFSRRNVLPAYEKEEILVDSDEARADVERFLRDKLMEIKEASDSLDPKWPEEQELWKLANASGGLFAYAQTVIRYIDDSTIGNPASQLSDVLLVIDKHPLTNVSREEHPMALLDALYARILSNVPLKIMINTRKLLLALASGWDWPLSSGNNERNFIVLCNWLGMTRDDAYAAINHLRSVLCVPRRDQAHEEKLKPFHKSFIDYISDFTRSGFSLDIKHEAHLLKTQCVSRVLKEAPDGIDSGDVDYRFLYGTLMRNPGIPDTILLTWLVDDEVDWNDNKTRLTMYKLAVAEVAAGIQHRDPTFQTEFYIRFLTTQFKKYNGSFPHLNLHDLVFDEHRRHEFMKYGILGQLLLKNVNISKISVSSCGSAVPLQ